MDSWFNMTSLSAVAVATTVPVAALFAYRWWTSPTKHSTEMPTTDVATPEVAAVERTFSDIELEVLPSSVFAVEEVPVLDVDSIELPTPAMAVEEAGVLDFASIKHLSPALAVEEAAVSRKLKKSRRKVDTRSKETAQQRKARNAQRMAERLAEEADEQSAMEEAIARIARNAAILGDEFMFQQTYAGWRSDWEIAYNEELKRLTANQAEICSICLEELVHEPGIGAQLNCSDRFHTSCLKPWIESKRTCPLCRDPNLDSIEPRSPFLAVEEAAVLDVDSIELPPSPVVAVEGAAVLDVETIELPSSALVVEEASALDVNSIELPPSTVVAIEEPAVTNADSNEPPSVPPLEVIDEVIERSKRERNERKRRARYEEYRTSGLLKLFF